MALPAGLQVRGGELTISQPDGTSLIINQGSKRAAGDWRSFDIDNGEQVEVRQPDSSSLMLGRVTGGTATQILGSLSADGGVILINPNGMLIGPNAVINTASFTASTSDVNPERSWLEGQFSFSAHLLVLQTPKLLTRAPSPFPIPEWWLCCPPDT